MRKAISKRHHSSKSTPNVDALLPELRALVPAELLDSLIRTWEVDDSPEAVDWMLRRFLAAEKLNLQHAAARLAKHATWRWDHLSDGIIHEDSILHQLAQEKTLLQPPAAGGTPLLIVKAGRHLPLGDLAELQRFIIYSLEAAAKLCDHASSPDRKLWAIFDLKDLRWANLDRHALSACFSVLTAAFPERVRCIYMLDAPFIFDGLWRVVSPFIDPTTRSKVQFVSGAAGRAALLGTLGAQVLPHTYGGSAEEVPVRQAAQQVQLQWRKQHEGRDGKGGAVAVAAAVPGAAREASLLSDKDAADDADSFVDACEELATVEA